MNKIFKNIFTSMFAGSIGVFFISTVVSCQLGIEETKVVAFSSDDYRDGSFREDIYKGVLRAYPNAKWQITSSNSKAAYLKAYRTYFAYGTDVVVGAGADHLEAIEDYSSKFKEKKYILVDEAINFVSEENNYTGIYYEVQEAAFVAGYALCQYSNSLPEFKDKKEIRFSGWGGADYVGVGNYLAGFRQGLDYWNQQNENAIMAKWVLYGEENRGDNFSGGWSPGANNAKDQNIAKGLIGSKKVDYLLPVAANQIATAIRISKSDSKGRVKVLGVDSDQTNIYLNDQELIVTSILKDSRNAVSAAVSAAILEDEKEWLESFGGKTYKATVANNGVGYVPIKDLEPHEHIFDYIKNNGVLSHKYKPNDNTNCDWATNGDNWCLGRDR